MNFGERVAIRNGFRGSESTLGCVYEYPYEDNKLWTSANGSRSETVSEDQNWRWDVYMSILIRIRSYERGRWVPLDVLSRFISSKVAFLLTQETSKFFDVPWPRHCFVVNCFENTGPVHIRLDYLVRTFPICTYFPLLFLFACFISPDTRSPTLKDLCLTLWL